MTSTSCKHLGFQFYVYEMQVLDSIYSEPLFFFFKSEPLDVQSWTDL